MGEPETSVAVCVARACLPMTDDSTVGRPVCSDSEQCRVCDTLALCVARRALCALWRVWPVGPRCTVSSRSALVNNHIKHTRRPLVVTRGPDRDTHTPVHPPPG